jgi:hypothetical protein
VRYLRSAAVAVIVATGLLLPATAGAQITSVSITVGHLQSGGAVVPVQLTVQCRPDWNVVFANVILSQLRAHSTGYGSGSFVPPFPGVRCPVSAPVTVNAIVPILEPLRFEPGEATASIDVIVINRETGATDEEIVTQEVRLSRG